jgi:ribosomal protein S13
MKAIETRNILNNYTTGEALDILYLAFDELDKLENLQEEQSKQLREFVEQIEQDFNQITKKEILNELKQIVNMK